MSLSNSAFYQVYFKSLDGVSEEVKRRMYKDNHSVYVKEYKDNGDTFDLGFFDINSKQGEFIDWHTVPKEAVHHFDVK